MVIQAQEKVGLIAQAEVEYEAIVEEVRGYCQKARELRCSRRIKIDPGSPE